MRVTEKVFQYIRKLVGESPYKAYKDVDSALNQVYFIKIKEKRVDGKLVITNPHKPEQKKKVKQIEALVEPDHIYPLIRWSG
ncbi:MAG: hypothetical protein QXR92_04155 [Fervidicoccaceae archaeon]|uniref:hypothetical protein n=1 Tax=Thermofilum sp. TaxID=1961369 RepID=UPI003163B331